jgi:hypothetical protein
MKTPAFVPQVGTLQEAKDYLKKHWREGAICPCCKQTVKLYKTPFSSNMGMFLTDLVKLYEEKKRPIHYSECKYSSRNYPHLSKWGMMFTEKSEKKEKRTTGFWTPTEKGIAFAKGEIKVLSTVLIYNNQIFGFTGDDVSIEDVLKMPFNYEDVNS